LSEFILREALGERRIELSQFPLSIGGPGNAIVIAELGESPQAHLGLHEDQLFVQPVDGAAVLHNGEQIQRSTWLHSGDVINFGPSRVRVSRSGEDRVLTVEDGAEGNITIPPVLPPRIHGGVDAESEHVDAVRFRGNERIAAGRGLHISPTRIVLTVVSLVAAAILWFIFTAVSISVQPNPRGAKVAVNGGIVVPIGDRFLLRPGKYEIGAQFPGYVPGHMTAQVSDVAGQQFELALQKLPGKLRIETPAPAQVSIDGKAAGAAPGELEVAPGKHAILIASERYQPFAATLEIEGAGKSQSFAPKLVPNWAVVTLSSEPAGAQVLVDGQPRGVTPLDTEILAGTHPVELRLQGFKSWNTDVQVKANEPTSIGPVQLGLPDGQLSVVTTPGGAAVSIAGVYRGQTPLQVEVRPNLAQDMVVTKPGYEAARSKVSLQPGEQRTVRLELAGVFGEVHVSARPADAQLIVDGAPTGNANQTLRLVAITHEVIIRKPGYVDFKTNLTPRPGVPQVIDTTLLTPEDAKRAATPTIIKTKAEQTLKLMPVGRFTMGSPRHEPGRRANEAQHDVELRRAFYVGTSEVTNGQFRRFRAGHRSGLVGQHTLDLDSQPVVSVNWNEAAEFCNWLSQQEGLPLAYEKKGDDWVLVRPLNTGYRLLTDAEWEWVARYEASGNWLRYPWGNALPVAPRSGNYADTTSRLLLQDIIPAYDDGFAVTAPVGKFPPNVLGLYDIGGNAAEWVNDYYVVGADVAAVAVDPLGPAEGKQHVIRGSSWRHSSVTDLRLSARDFGDGPRNDVGFRIARYAE
jgi:formylglycine-generating enzyme required for sulfatase activity